MVALGMEEVHGPADVIKGIPLNVATPFSSVKRCYNNETSKHKTHPKQNINMACLVHVFQVSDHCVLNLNFVKELLTRTFFIQIFCDKNVL